MLFLLGGYDLEMITIRELLLANDFCEVTASHAVFLKGFADKRLSWGARLSEYREFFHYEGPLYGIELTGDIDAPANYKKIDHHNELYHLPSGIEQVAAILGIALNRYQQLVAANDKGFIPALEAMHSSQKEINEIRMADRKAQGVTEQDELLAEESICKHLRMEQGITIIHSLTDKFSPITDRMYGQTERLVVYTDKKLVYYGMGASKLAEHFSGLVKERKAYSGGGENGYFGLVEGVFDREGIEEELINNIKLFVGE